MTKEEIEESNRKFEAIQQAKIEEIVSFFRDGDATPEQWQALGYSLLLYDEEYSVDEIFCSEPTPGKITRRE